jgi:hypothetical protein
MQVSYITYLSSKLYKPRSRHQLNITFNPKAKNKYFKISKFLLYFLQIYYFPKSAYSSKMWQYIVRQHPK